MRYFISSFLLLALATLISWQTPSPNDWRQKVDRKLLERSRNQTELDFLVVLKEQKTADVNKTLTKDEKAKEVFGQLQALATRSQKSIVKTLRQEGISYESLYIVNALRIQGDLALVQRLAEREDVVKIQDNHAIRRSNLLPAQPNLQRGPRTLEWGLTHIKVDEVWALGYRGEGVVIGGEDTGYDWSHPALQSKYRGWDGTVADHNYNWHDAIHSLNPLNNYPNDDPNNNPCGLDADTPCDDNGHGTWTMGIMVGDEGDNQIGVAPEAKWIGCRNMENAWGSRFTYLECLQWFMAPTDLNGENPDPTKAPHVINNSWVCPEIEGCTIDNWQMLEQAVNNLRTSGVFVAVAAGNDGRDSCGSINAPATIFENSFTVGALDPNDTVGVFSSRGPVMVDGSMRIKPNITAPGRDIRSSGLNGTYTFGTGTSGAAPFVAGTVALMISANPQLAGRVELLEDILEQTATPRTSDELCDDENAIPNNSYGYGTLNAFYAVELALLATSTEESLSSPDNWRVYPNPVKDLVNFEMPKRAASVMIDLFDATGRLLHSTQWPAGGETTHRLSLATYPTGLYFYRISNGKQLVSGRLVKQ